MSQMAQVWVAYATPEQQWHMTVAFQQGMTVLDAIQQSGIATATTLSEPLMVGIFGVRVEPQHVLQAGDRVEIYRALTINPKDIRRNRAAKNPVGRYAKSNRLRQLK
ncbi:MULTISPECIES: RnfH family protein [Acinetobacter]|uniref:UPF0125 protein BJN41_05585 n=1 Tax=Acinetobacter towneri TaxID=202956 RepID=A0A1E8E1L7_9GAMM|nr:MULTISPECIES: RnfH family protein [Acinetobacter]MCD0188600.1 RnfH family protein [Acinetobacter sp. PW68]OFE43562.1 RnfH family protein [Acinetobacter towneri]